MKQTFKVLLRRPTGTKVKWLDQGGSDGPIPVHYLNISTNIGYITIELWEVPLDYTDSSYDGLIFLDRDPEDPQDSPFVTLSSQVMKDSDLTPLLIDLLNEQLIVYDL